MAPKIATAFPASSFQAPTEAASIRIEIGNQTEINFT
jgi:hypothetical protein